MELDTAVHPDTFREKIILPSKYQLRHTPARALFSLLDAALAMTLLAVDRDYPDLQQIMWSAADGEKINRSSFIAHSIAEYCLRLREFIAAYDAETEREHHALQFENSPLAETSK